MRGGPWAWAAAVAAAAAVTAGAPREARPCGAFFPAEAQSNLAFEAQRALLIVGEDERVYHLQMGADTTAEDFVWVFPVPAVPTLELGSDAVFEGLDALTTPTILLPADDDGGGGGCGACAGDAARAGGDLGGDPVQHLGGGRIGSYAYDFLQGQDTAEMVAWLEEAGYVLPQRTSEVLEPYAAAHMVFIWIKLSRSQNDPEVTAFEPLVVRFPASRATGVAYPLSLSALSAADVNPVILYVLADQRYRVTTYGSADLALVGQRMLEARESFASTAYDDVVDAMTAAAGGRLFITEHASSLKDAPSLSDEVAALVTDDTFYLTRLYARVPFASLVDAALTFADDAPDVPSEVDLSAQRAPRDTLPAGGAFAWALLVLAALGALRLHRAAPAPHRERR